MLAPIFVIIGKRLFLQSSNALFERLDDAFGIGLFLAFKFDNGGGGIVHELFVAEFLHNTSQETFFVFQLGFHASNFGTIILLAVGADAAPVASASLLITRSGWCACLCQSQLHGSKHSRYRSRNGIAMDAMHWLFHYCMLGL